MNLIIREATLEDAKYLSEFRYRMFTEMKPEADFSQIREELIRESEAYFSARTGSSEIYSVVVAADGKVVGGGTLMCQERPPSVRALKNIVGDICNVFVEPECRSHGIARRIMEALHAEGEARGVKRFVLSASEFGEPLYKKIGYTVNRRFMEKDL